MVFRPAFGPETSIPHLALAGQSEPARFGSTRSWTVIPSSASADSIRAALVENWADSQSKNLPNSKLFRFISDRERVGGPRRRRERYEGDGDNQFGRARLPNNRTCSQGSRYITSAGLLRRQTCRAAACSAPPESSMLQPNKDSNNLGPAPTSRAGKRSAKKVPKLRRTSRRGLWPNQSGSYETRILFAKTRLPFGSLAPPSGSHSGASPHQL